MADEPVPKPVRWMGASHEALKSFPKAVRNRIGRALFAAQIGNKFDYAKPLKGFGHAGVLEIVAAFDGNAYRAVYTIRFAERLYVLHVFEKKSKTGISTPKREIELIQNRLKHAQQDYALWRAKSLTLKK